MDLLIRDVTLLDGSDLQLRTHGLGRQAYAMAAYVQGALHDDLISMDFTFWTWFRLPAFFFAERHDCSTPSEVTAEFQDAVRAPMKDFFWFEDSGNHRCDAGGTDE